MKIMHAQLHMIPSLESFIKIIQVVTDELCRQSLVIITSLAKGGYVSGSVGLSVCLWTAIVLILKSYELIEMSFLKGSWVVQ